MSDTPPFPAVPQTRHRLLRGSNEDHDTFVGMYGELTYDTTNKTARVHDGETLGGFVLSKEGHEHTLDAISDLPKPDIENAGKFLQVSADGNYGLADTSTSTTTESIIDASPLGRTLMRAADSQIVREVLGVDSGLPKPTVENVGKTLVVNEVGEYELDDPTKDCLKKGWHMIGIPAMAFYPPAVATQPAIWSSAGNFRTWTFGPTTSDYYLFEIPLPPSWNGKTIRPRMCWAMGSNTTAGNAVLRAGFLYQPMGAVITPAWTQTASMTVPCAVGTNYIATTEFPAWDALNVDPSKPGRLFGYAQRLGADIADTAPGTMYLRGLDLFYQVNKGDDS